MTEKQFHLLRLVAELAFDSLPFGQNKNDLANAISAIEQEAFSDASYREEGQQ